MQRKSARGTEGIGPIPSGGISQPPVAATFIRAIWESDKQAGTERLRVLIPKIMAWHKWFIDWRTSDEGAVFISQGNLAQVAALGLEVTMGVRLDAAVHDVSNMYGIYLPVVAVALLIALPVARLVMRFLPDARMIGYTLAGFVALLAVHLIMEQVFGGIVGIAPVRFIDGLLLQGLAGAFGGFAFHFVSRQSAAASS